MFTTRANIFAIEHLPGLDSRGRGEEVIEFSRVWAMPNANTFSINPIGELIQKWNTGKSVDPFANSNRLATVCNDLDPAHGCEFTMDALDFLRSRESGEFDTVLFDPPYSPRQVSECYKSLGKTVNLQTTQASFWGNLKKEIARVCKDDGTVITCGWNTGGIGKNLGFDIVEILLVPHGGWHNDTIVTVEKKKPIMGGLFAEQEPRHD